MDRGALQGSNAEGERDWEFSRVAKDTKIYQAVSGDFERGDGGVGSSLVRRDRSWMTSLYRIGFRIDKDAHIDKEYTGIDKITMCVYGQCASFARQAERTIGCNELLARVLSVADLVQNRSQICTVASAL